MTEEKIIIVDNPTNLPLAKLDDFVLFQGDLKMPITGPAMQSLKTSILDHRIFIGKAAAWFNGELLTEDGHQTLYGLKSLREDGYTSCQVVNYEKKDGNMVEGGINKYNEIMVPYQLVVPQGKKDYERRKDAAAKIAIINSQYAELNPNTSFFTALNFNAEDIQRLQSQVHFSKVMFEGFTGFTNVVNSQPAIPPEDFKEYDEDIETEYQCPKCGYSWGGKPK